MARSRHVSDDWRALRLRRDGTCIACNADLPADTQALWSRSAGAVRCASHGAADTGPADEPAPTAAAGWHTLTLRRAATCVDCGAALAVGAPAQWHRALRVTRCLVHHDPASVAATAAPAIPAPPSTVAIPASPPAAPRATGTAGGSAGAEYERRRARREQRVRDAHPVLGGLILALSDEPQNVAAWRQGAAGERAVG